MVSSNRTRIGELERVDLHRYLVDRLREAIERCEARMNLALQALEMFVGDFLPQSHWSEQ